MGVGGEKLQRVVDVHRNPLLQQIQSLLLFLLYLPVHALLRKKSEENISIGGKEKAYEEKEKGKKIWRK